MPEDNDEDLIPAATVVLGRNSTDGLEVLMLRRNSKIAFGGAWVFPGGRVDPQDAGENEVSRARSAAVREAAEETGLDLSNRPLPVWSYWVPPVFSAMLPTKGKRRRFSTWFFVAKAPDAEVVIDMGEIHEHRWLSPSAALEIHAKGEIELVPPTWVTLHSLAEFETINEVIQATHGTDPARFRTRPVPGEPVTLLWEGDIAYDHPERLEHSGGRNRLVMATGNWTYERL